MSNGYRFARNVVLSTAVLALSHALTASADIVHVPGDQPTIQSGINVAQNGDTVLVADGVYRGFGNRNIDLGGKAITVRSENGPGGCIIKCDQKGLAFCFVSGEGPESIVRGFTITAGYT